MRNPKLYMTFVEGPLEAHYIGEKIKIYSPQEQVSESLARNVPLTVNRVPVRVVWAVYAPNPETGAYEETRDGVFLKREDATGKALSTSARRKTETLIKAAVYQAAERKDLIRLGVAVTSYHLAGDATRSMVKLRKELAEWERTLELHSAEVEDYMRTFGTTLDVAVEANLLAQRIRKEEGEVAHG